jgi:hypothetical protein
MDHGWMGMEDPTGCTVLVQCHTNAQPLYFSTFVDTYPLVTTYRDGLKRMLYFLRNTGQEHLWSIPQNRFAP